MFCKTTFLFAAVAALGVVNAQQTDSANSTSSATISANESSTASSSAASASSTVVPISTSMIPTNISTGCSSFLDSLNTDSQFTTCMTPLANITALYNPVANSSAQAALASTVTSTLTQLCASSTGCSDSLIQTYLSSFYSACTAELTNPNSYSEDVREIYDFLYVVNPFMGAVCSRDGSSQKYCVLEIAASAAANSTSTTNSTSANSTATNSTSLMSSFKTFVTTQDLFSPQVALAAANLVIVQTANTANSISRRFLSLLPRAGTTGISSDAIITPNTTTYLSTGIAYLFLQPNMSSSLLCTSCTKSILASYVAWEAQVPYALGLASSPILGKQSALWSSVATTCGSTFMNSITSQAGILSANATASSSTGTSGGMITAKVGFGGVIATILGVAGATLL